MKAKVANKAAFKDNGWFVGVTPRRNPEIVVAVLVEGGEHGYLAARMAAQVIKAYVEKQRAKQVNVATAGPEEKPEAKPATSPEAAGAETAKPEPSKPVPATTTKPKPAEMTGLWGGTNNALHGSRFRIAGSGAGSSASPAESKFHPAVAAPGMEAFAEHSDRVTANLDHLPADKPANKNGTKQKWDYAARGTCYRRISLQERFPPMRRHIRFRDFDWVLLLIVMLICALGVHGDLQRHPEHEISGNARQAGLLDSRRTAADVYSRAS